MQDPPPKAIDRLAQLVSRLGRPARSERWQRLSLLMAVVVFVAASVVAYLNFPEERLPPRWLPILLAAVVGVPATTLLNAAEYRVAARLLRHRPAFARVMQVTLLASAANLLPIPGSFLVRTRSLRDLGSTYRQAASSNAIVALAWLGVTGVLAGALQLAGTARALGAVLILAGALALLSTNHLLVARLERGEVRRTALELLLVESGFVVVGTFRFYAILVGLGFDVTLSQAVAFTVAGVVASATGFFPGGLGIRELLAAGISPLIGLPAAAGLLAAAADRLVGLAVLGVLAAIVLAALPASDAEVGR
ncbi:MAG: hypothetical protein M3N51_05375 [Actinomycetota bacterium]|nr:hypothetical protein [Actinomycetota bacterium]